MTHDVEERAPLRPDPAMSRNGQWARFRMTWLARQRQSIRILLLYAVGMLQGAELALLWTGWFGRWRWLHACVAVLLLGAALVLLTCLPNPDFDEVRTQTR
jgi:hypothetical protein